MKSYDIKTFSPMIIVSYVYCCLVMFIRFPPKRVKISQISINLRFSLNIFYFFPFSAILGEMILKMGLLRLDKE
jgi:hypothetical protein